MTLLPFYDQKPANSIRLKFGQNTAKSILLEFGKKTQTSAFLFSRVIIESQQSYRRKPKKREAEAAGAKWHVFHCMKWATIGLVWPLLLDY